MKILKLALLLIPVAGLVQPVSTKTIAWHPQQIAELGTVTVRQIAWSPDGSILATSASQGVWFFDPNTPKKPPERLQEAVQAMAFSPDGQYLACAMGDSIRIWDLQKRTSQTIDAKQMADAIAYSPDGKWMAWGGQNSRIQVWDRQKNKPGLTLLDSGAITALTFSPDDAYLYAKNSAGAPRQWNLKTSQSRLRLAGMSLSPNGKLILIPGMGYTDGILVDTHTGQQVADLSFPGQPSAAAWSGDFSADGKLLTLAGTEGLAGLWNIQTQQFQKVTIFGKALKDPEKRPSFLQAAFDPKGNRVALLTDKNLIYLWDIQTDDERILLTGHHDGDTITALAFSPDGKSLASESSDRVVWLWNIETRQGQAGFLTQDYGWSLAFSADSRLLAAGTFSGIYIWDVTSGTLVKTLGADKDQGVENFGVEGVAFHPADPLIAAAAYTDTQIWNWKTGQLLNTFDKGNQWGCVAFSPKGDQLAVAGLNFLVWDMQQQTVLTSMSHDVLGNETPFCAVTFSTDGRSLALLKQHGLSILDTNTWTEKQLTTLHSFRTVHISLSQDSKLVAAEDQIWDMGTGQSVAQFNQAIDIQFDPDASANLIAVADWYGHLGLWQLS